MHGVVYALCEPWIDPAVDDFALWDVRYIGQTTRPDWRRYCEKHYRKAVNSDNPKRYVHRWLRTLDQQPVIVLVQECDSQDELDRAENDWIMRLWKLHVPLTNVKGGGSNGKLSPEARAKMSEALRGRTHTDEHRRHVSEAHRGKKHTDETRRKIGEAHRGKTLSDEHRRKLSEASRGQKHTDETRRRMSEARRRREPPSAETRRKISEANRRRKPPTAETRRKIREGNRGKTVSNDTRRKLSEAATRAWARRREAAQMAETTA